MTLKKKEFAADEFPIFDDAVIFMRGEFWQFRMWLAKEHKYARFSLKARNKNTATDEAKLQYHGFYPVFTDGYKTPENSKSLLATLRRIRGL